ncbi:MAG: hypothetical protein WCO45_05075 [Pseudanabaena sp. ELA607]
MGKLDSAKVGLDKLGGFTAAMVIIPTQVRHCHVSVHEGEKPVPAIEYNGHTYSMFRVCTTWDDVEKLTSRLSDDYVITIIKRGWVIWAFEF